MPDPDYLKEGKGLDAEAFQKELDKLAEQQKQQQEEQREQERKELEQRFEEGDPAVIASPKPAADNAGPQGLTSPGADDSSFGPTQVDPSDAAATQEEKKANEKLLDVAAAGQDVNQGDGTEDDRKAAQEEAKDAVKDAKRARKEQKGTDKPREDKGN